MVKREKLLSDLKGFLSFEEEAIQKLSTFYKALGWRNYIKKEYHDKVDAGLDVLRNDTTKHANLIKEMIQYVESSNKDEF